LKAFADSTALRETRTLKSNKVLAMDRRELLGAMGAATVGLAGLSRAAAQADKEQQHHNNNIHEY